MLIEIVFALAQETPQETALKKLAAQVPALLKAADKDGSGALSVVEFRDFAAAAEKAGKASLAELDPSIARKKAEKDLEKHDTNGDGTLDDAEKKAMAEEKRLKDLKDFDWDGDGKLDERERTAQGWAAEGKSAALFRKIDADANGQVSVDEAKAQLAAVADIKLKKPKEQP